MKTIFMLLILALLTGCESIGSKNVDGIDMLRVQETGAGFGAGWLPWAHGAGDVGGCRMERTGELPDGTVFEYNGDKCHVKVIN